MTYRAGGILRYATASFAAFSSAAYADHAVGGAGASIAGPIMTVPAETLEQGAWVAGLRLNIARPDRYSDAALIDLANRHVHAHSSDYTLTGTASLAYGLTDHFMVGIALPYIHRHAIREGEHHHVDGSNENSVADKGSIGGIGDLTMFGQYQFAHNHEAGWGLAVLAGLKLPTGSTHRRDPEGERFETEQQPGTGSWDPLIGLAASKQLGRFSIDTNVLYQFATRGAQRTELGDRKSVNLAISYALSAEDPHDEDAAPHDHGGWVMVLEANGEFEARQRIDDEVEEESGAKVVYLSPGVRYVSASGWSASASLGVPVWQQVRASHPDNESRLIIGMSKRF